MPTHGQKLTAIVGDLGGGNFSGGSPSSCQEREIDFLEPFLCSKTLLVDRVCRERLRDGAFWDCARPS